MATIASISIVRAAGAVAVVTQPPTHRPQHRGEGPIGTRQHTSMHACRRTYGMSVCNLWRAGKRGQRSRHTLDAPALEYVPASQEAHVADELAPVALEYVPATQEAHVDAPAPPDSDHVPVKPLEIVLPIVITFRR